MSWTFFTDRDLGKQFPEVLRAAGLKVERHADHFSPTASDEEWLERTGREHWTAITHDGRIRYKPNQLAAVERHEVGLLVVVGKAPYRELADYFVNSLPRIEAFLNEQVRPFIAKIHRPSPTDLRKNPAASGNVTLWYPR